MAAPHFICNSCLISMVGHSFVSRHKYCNNSDKTVFFICYYRLYFQKILKLCLYFPRFICYYRLYFQKFLNYVFIFLLSFSFFLLFFFSKVLFSYLSFRAPTYSTVEVSALICSLCLPRLTCIAMTLSKRSFLVRIKIFKIFEK